jgi:hypothetical protein
MQHDFKASADRLHSRRLTALERRAGRRIITPPIAVADLRRAALSLAARADAIIARRDRDPVLRALADAEAEHCRRLADTFRAAITEATR